MYLLYRSVSVVRSRFAFCSLRCFSRVRVLRCFCRKLVNKRYILDFTIFGKWIFVRFKIRNHLECSIWCQNILCQIIAFLGILIRFYHLVTVEWTNLCFFIHLMQMSLNEFIYYLDYVIVISVLWVLENYNDFLIWNISWKLCEIWMDIVTFWILYKHMSTNTKFQVPTSKIKTISDWHLISDETTVLLPQRPIISRILLGF